MTNSYTFNADSIPNAVCVSFTLLRRKQNQFKPECSVAPEKLPDYSEKQDQTTPTGRLQLFKIINLAFALKNIIPIFAPHLKK
ncbi:hypothetical protein WG906_00040 [Pedobacter sp. P351]|uniref:hypothetical protein n=1 Tax=Pedobacter superstes TaxID=3133441 RepID=UPI0030A7485D